MRRFRAAVALALFLGVVGSSPRLLAQGVSGPVLRAAFLLNFAKFTEWPESQLPETAPIVICSTDDEVSAVLESSVPGRVIGQHPVAVSRVKVDAVPPGCAVLYTRTQDAKKVAALAAQARGTGVLLVGETEAFVTFGGAIGFFVDGSRMRFAICVASAQHAGLRFSAQLLALAKLIKD
jgi:hypothetical protein